MGKQHFLYKMIPPRPSFHLDQDENEMKVMQQHMEYWQEQTEMNSVIVFGPVFDPNGVYGMAVIEANDEVEANEIAKNDPAVASGVCIFELIPMRVGKRTKTNQ